ncbi:alpha/beta hydrolase [Methylonatrum kenyense]|uniref:alpha/beta fold hydrolase n=1 Tax=Methylonatrum kenyense TaxID=455253 RepID=UPI0020BE6CB9|nr:alpha/beta hydrolase [Methylonatrum kenyense]MCK8514916.1 alpha/beta hydrolase [Methylonatrum kenyense]
MQIRKGYVDTAEGQVHYRSTQGAGPPVVFLHQTASSSAMWKGMMTIMEGRRCIAPDTPGFGGSYDPEDVPDIGYYAQVMTEALDALGVREFHLCGHHTGSCIAVEMAAAMPGRVLSLTMFGPPQLTQDERDQFRPHFSTPFAPDADGAYLKATWDYLAGLGANKALDLHHREVVDTLRAWHGRVQAYAAVWEQDFPAFLEQVTCPMLLLCARDDVLWPYFQRAAEARPDALLEVVQGANFEPDLDASSSARAYEAFLGQNGARQREAVSQR